MRVTQRLTDSPACLVADEHDIGGNLARMLKAAGQKRADVEADPRDQPEAPAGRAAQGRAMRRFDDWASVLFDQALLAEGGQLEDPAGFVRRINELMLSLTKQ